jgi:uncharacterized membrane protein HdeD (DUF308 family)
MAANSLDVDHARRARRIGAAGWFVIALSALAAFLPMVGPAHGAAIIGGMLIFAGLAEIFAGTLRQETRKLAMLAGAVTAVAGLLFSTDPATKFMPTLIIIMGWLFLRSVILAVASLLEHGSVRFWTGLSAATDFILALFLAVGVAISALVVSLFGATPPLIANFAWVLAVSFIATGSLLLEVASCARRELV